MSTTAAPSSDSSLTYRPIPTISEQAKSLAAFLADRTSATYAELSAVVGEDIREHRGWLTTAINVLRRERNQVWVAVRGVGVKLANAAEVIDAARCEVSKAHHAAKRGIKRISTLDFDSLPNAERLRLNTVASHLGALHGITTQRAAERLSAAVNVQQAKLPLSKTLAAFAGSNGGGESEGK